MSDVTEAAFWDVDEAACHLGVSTWTVRRMVRDKELLHVRVRGAIRIPKAREGFSPLIPTQRKRRGRPANILVAAVATVAA